VSQYQKGKTNLDLLEQEIMNGSGISWAICKSAPRSRQITTPVPPPLSFLQVGCLTPLSLASLKSRMVYLSAASCPGKEAVKRE